MNEFFHIFLSIFNFPFPDFTLGAFAFLGVFVLIYNLLFRRSAYKVR